MCNEYRGYNERRPCSCFAIRNYHAHNVIRITIALVGDAFHHQVKRQCIFMERIILRVSCGAILSYCHSILDLCHSALLIILWLLLDKHMKQRGILHLILNEILNVRRLKLNIFLFSVSEKNTAKSLIPTVRNSQFSDWKLECKVLIATDQLSNLCLMKCVFQLHIHWPQEGERCSIQFPIQ